MQNQPIKYGFVAPALIFLILFNIFPLFYNIYLSFTDAELSGGLIEFIGTRNFGIVFDDPHYASALRTTGMFVVLAVSIELLLGFTLALSIHLPFRGKTVVLTFLLIPMMLSPAVMGLYWNFILNGHYGVLNQIIALFAWPQPQWLTDPDLKLISILMIDIWMWTPFMMLISLAGLNAVPKHLYEAAAIDRASTWTTFRRITLPLCSPLLFLAVLFRTTDALKQFDLVMSITGPNDHATQTLSALLYQTMFRSYKTGLGSAYGLVILVIIIALSSMFIRYMTAAPQKQGRTS
ncbi:MAG: sugar ABC transporter permease [Candidatus Latescibacteria bacterium]|jgi:multiple sugar transport system permease protein|nr:sugar ABC transporter permease [Candidatus Latescibacterota bacterium]MBT4137923.1 sugar ABC transporter permease [Candidatus Latescibacterota bacterium]MBT5832717.1 sugar ABC transporter permease [Candidatus Latescibacterota bacterium]